MYRNKGFTLVELVVSMALLSMLSVMAYGLFGISSDNLLEVDALESTSSRGRFAVEKLRNLFQGAGAYASPDSLADPFVEPKRNSGTALYRVSGFQTYPNWQDQSMGDLPSAKEGSSTVSLPSGVVAANPDISFDGIILTGAYDFPVAFEAGGFTSDARTSLVIPGTFLGLEKLFRVNPFSDLLTPQSGVACLKDSDCGNSLCIHANGLAVGQKQCASEGYLPNLQKQDWTASNSYSFLSQDWDSRLIRLTDGLGYNQFVASDGSTSFTPSNALGFPGLLVPLQAAGGTFTPVYKGSVTGLTASGTSREEIGIDLAGIGEGDRTYEASLIDTFWLHVVRSENLFDPTNMMLVLDRLCAPQVAAMKNIGSISNIQSARGGSSDCGTTSRTMIADRVVDFQIWFDCADADGNIANNQNWSRSWLTPNGTVNDTCMNPGAGFQPGKARVAHARITMRTDEERPGLRHHQFEPGDGSLCTSSAGCPNATLRTFDVNPDLVGSSPVITYQTDIALRNFIIKDL